MGNQFIWKYLQLGGILLILPAAVQGNISGDNGVDIPPQTLDHCFHDPHSESQCWQGMLSEPVAARQYDFGVHYANGDSIRQDLTRGRYWIHQAAVGGYPLAEYNLGVMFYDGIGGQLSQECAVHWLNKAAGSGGEVGDMAQQALTEITHNHAQHASKPRVYRALTPSQCEILPYVNFPVSPSVNEAVQLDTKAGSLDKEVSIPEATVSEDQPHDRAKVRDVESAATDKALQAPVLKNSKDQEASDPIANAFADYITGSEHEVAIAPVRDHISKKTDDTSAVVEENTTSKSVMMAPEISQHSSASAENTLQRSQNSSQTGNVWRQRFGKLLVRMGQRLQSEIQEDSFEGNSTEKLAHISAVPDALPITVPASRDALPTAPLSAETDSQHSSEENIADKVAPKAVINKPEQTSQLKGENETTCVGKEPSQPKQDNKKSTKSRSLNLGGSLRNSLKHHFTLQLSSASQAEPLQALARKHALTNYLVYETRRYDRQWFVLVYGEYQDLTHAKMALGQLPQVIRKNDPWARRLGHVQAEL